MGSTAKGISQIALNAPGRKHRLCSVNWKKVFFKPASWYNFDCSTCRLHVQRRFCDRRYTTRFPQIKQKKYFRVICRIFMTVLSSTHMFKSSVMTYSNRSVLRNFRRERLNVNYFLTFKFSKNHYL